LADQFEIQSLSHLGHACVALEKQCTCGLVSCKWMERNANPYYIRQPRVIGLHFSCLHSLWLVRCTLLMGLLKIVGPALYHCHNHVCSFGKPWMVQKENKLQSAEGTYWIMCKQLSITRIRDMQLHVKFACTVRISNRIAVGLSMRSDDVRTTLRMQRMTKWA
jgi:hypothetical protein